MQYYYLGAGRRPQGPVSQETLFSLLEEGKISAATEIASKGAKSWEPVGVVFAERLAADAPRAAAPAPETERCPNACPACHAAIACAEGDLPPRCPACGYDLGQARGSILSRLSRAFRLYADTRGRATRADYWSYTLTMGVITWIAFLFFISLWIVVDVVRLQVPVYGDDELLSLCNIMIVGSGVVMLLLLIPLFTVGVRRLHDTGRSGWRVGALFFVTALAVLLCKIICRLYIGLLITTLTDLQDMTDLSYYPSMNAESWLDALLLLLSLLLCVSLVLHIDVFFLCLTDSQRGANQYGPSVKYPEG